MTNIDTTPSILRDALPAGTDTAACTVTTYGILGAEHDVDYEYLGDIPDDAPVIVLPGWAAADAHGDTVTYPGADDADEASQAYVDGADYSDWESAAQTAYIHMRAWRIGYVLADLAAEEVLELRIDDTSRTIEIEPREPDCEDGQTHDWQSPHEVVGGLEENPGVHGHGGGVVITEICAHCGLYRVTDTWAQDRETGEQGLTSVAYQEADDASSEWVSSRAESQDAD